ncbi:hypothetical protein FisN_5Hh486 [Fistulifera solaris]|uniref:Uncharacterized protein n=1 Tax=Fistulifera solaris TaxID=1519565 RepID=A0A1Z5JSU6_FISSO|nr:hypothetical protein FisN_5Hh486 [Fistulifera solaris]|eukprot:GAX17100.1 hypothetical protein FisN_5Hh486 [Fistulifera solaris]
MMKLKLYVPLFATLTHSTEGWAAIGYATIRRQATSRPLRLQSSKSENIDLEVLKKELSEYLEKRKELSADELAKEIVGKTIGGTKGNPILEFVSAAPNKGFVIEAPPNPFDYDELTKYGYGHLATPIMKAGGRFAMYELLEMKAPPVTSKPKPKAAPKLVIDRTGETDKARYSGLKLGQVLDDSLQAEALQAVQKKIEAGEDLRPKLEEELFERPFADRRNVGPQLTPDWTPERLDEWGKQQGKALAWARKAREGQFVKDPFESLDLELSQRMYSLLTALLISMAFGRSTQTMLADNDVSLSVEIFRAPAVVLLIASVVSSVLSSVQAGSLNRNRLIWFIKGLLGGPLTVKQLGGLSNLLTEAETNAIANK